MHFLALLRFMGSGVLWRSAGKEYPAVSTERLLGDYNDASFCSVVYILFICYFVNLS